jgi:hypothetical protein
MTPHLTARRHRDHKGGDVRAAVPHRPAQSPGRIMPIGAARGPILIGGTTALAAGQAGDPGPSTLLGKFCPPARITTQVPLRCGLRIGISRTAIAADEPAGTPAGAG